jgi:hypothetical protein
LSLFFFCHFVLFSARSGVFVSRQRRETKTAERQTGQNDDRDPA